MNLLHFYAKGSSNAIYKITAEGSAAGLRMYCTCPAGARGGIFCKHIAALLVGDVTALQQNSDSVLDLAERATGSPLVMRALEHAPRPNIEHRRPDTQDLTRDAPEEIARCRRAGYTTEASADSIAIHALLKSGKSEKRPTVALTRRAKGGYTLTIRGGDKQSFRYLDIAIIRLQEAVENLPPKE